MGLCQGFLCGACLSASNKLDMTDFNELWARGSWDAIVHVVADKGYDCSSFTRSYQKTGENTRHTQAQWGHLSQRVRSRALSHITPSSDYLPISKNINALLHASISWMQPSFLFSLSLVSMCLKYFVNSIIAEPDGNDYGILGNVRC